MAISSVKSYEGLIRLELRADTPDDLKQLLRSDGLIRSIGKRCCRSRRMTEGAYGRDPIFFKRWRCGVCKGIENFLTGSLFESCHLKPFVVLKMAYAYVHLGLNRNMIRDVMEDPPSAAVLTVWLQKFRDIMSKEVFKETTGKFGGPGKLVVIDETVLAKRKYHHAQGQPSARATCLVLGIYDVEKKEGTLQFLQSRTCDEVLPKILSAVEVGSVIHTDERATYASLPAHGYVHRTVSHSETFKAHDGTHINHVLSYFGRAKNFLRKRNAGRLGFIPSYLDEFMWTEKHRNTRWRDFIAAVRRQHRV